MKSFCELFLCSSKELKNVRNLVAAGILMTTGIVLNLFTVPITPVMRLSLGFLVSAIIGTLFGPAVGIMCGGLGDIINYLIFPSGPYFPGLTLSGMLAGMMYGIALYNKKITVIRCAVVIIIVTIVVEILLNTYWLSLLYGKGFYVLLPLRAAKDLIMIPIKVASIYFLLNMVNRIRNI
ncbi:folate family ECF transporter S component [Clostridium sp.]|uniref:folate family ECF transporter S component n=1 Tax=Clostridium sp. TaxID=1506 RepID=UPI00284C8F51|nr:folate family ECF transporter S component [Clostridium sp.]MDR3598109.1 folate family ECF transporter S component [Clostridium sp.]